MIAESGAFPMQQCGEGVVACLMRGSHGVRVAAAGCLYQLAVCHGGFVSTVFPVVVMTLDQSFRHITSAAAVAATAASAAASYAGSSSSGKKDKLGLFAISKAKSGVC